MYASIHRLMGVINKCNHNYNLIISSDGAKMKHLELYPTATESCSLKL